MYDMLKVEGCCDMLKVEGGDLGKVQLNREKVFGKVQANSSYSLF
jgi:hypothetical protein